MPDSQPARAMPPRSWSEAFAGLPDEMPAGDGWMRVAQALDTPTVRTRRARPGRRWPLWLAAAAVLAVVAMVPFGLVDKDPSPPARLSAPAVATDPASTHAARVRDVGEDPSAARTEARQAQSATTSAAPSAATHGIAFDPVTARVRKPARTIASASRSSTSPKPPPAATESISSANGGPSSDAIAAVQADSPLQLQAESAQLEALVAFARDERVASASSAVLAGNLDARIGLIDAALSQPDVPDAQRTALWQARVDALRDLAGVETTQRWLAARGERYDGALVRVD